MRRDQDASPSPLLPGASAKVVIRKLALMGDKSRLYDAALSWNLRVAVRPSKLACTTTEES
jgi:hypothetical protein